MPQVQVQGHQVLLEVVVTGSLGLQATALTVMCGPQLSLEFHLVNWETVADAETKIFHRVFREETHKYRCNCKSILLCYKIVVMSVIVHF
jgi:hypothetical protein